MNKEIIDEKVKPFIEEIATSEHIDICADLIANKLNDGVSFDDAINCMNFLMVEGKNKEKLCRESLAKSGLHPMACLSIGKFITNLKSFN